MISRKSNGWSVPKRGTSESNLRLVMDAKVNFLLKIRRSITVNAIRSILFHLLLFCIRQTHAHLEVSPTTWRAVFKPSNAYDICATVMVIKMNRAQDGLRGGCSDWRAERKTWWVHGTKNLWLSLRNSQHSHHSWSEGRHGRRDRRWGRMDQIERWHRSSRERCWGRVLTWQPVWRWGYCPSLRWQHPAHPNGGCGSSWSESLGSDEWPGL